MSAAEKILKDALALSREERKSLSEALVSSLSVDPAEARPDITKHLEASIERNRELYSRLAR